MTKLDRISRYDFGQTVFQSLRTGVPGIPYTPPITNRTRDITDPVMLLQRDQRLREVRRIAEHNRGEPIRIWQHSRQERRAIRERQRRERYEATHKKAA